MRLIHFYVCINKKKIINSRHSAQLVASGVKGLNQQTIRTAGTVGGNQPFQLLGTIQRPRGIQNVNIMNQKQFAARGIVTQQRNLPNQTLKIATTMNGKYILCDIYEIVILMKCRTVMKLKNLIYIH